MAESRSKSGGRKGFGRRRRPERDSSTMELGSFVDFGRARFAGGGAVNCGSGSAGGGGGVNSLRSSATVAGADGAAPGSVTKPLSDGSNPRSTGAVALGRPGTSAASAEIVEKRMADVERKNMDLNFT